MTPVDGAPAVPPCSIAASHVGRLGSAEEDDQPVTSPVQTPHRALSDATSAMVDEMVARHEEHLDREQNFQQLSPPRDRVRLRRRLPYGGGRVRLATAADTATDDA